MVENIPRILPDSCGAKIDLGTWPILPLFKTMQSIGSIDDDEMFRTFNMGIGMAIIVDPLKVDDVKTVLSKLTPVFEIGKISSGNKDVVIA